MTTSGRAGNPPRRRPAEADTTQGTVRSPDAAVGGGKPGKGPLADGLPPAPDDPQQLRQEIERTREQLGETVEQLAAKADVMSRAQTRAAEVSRRVKAKASQVQQQAAARAGKVRGQLVGRTAAARHKAVSAGGAGQDQLQSRLAAVGTPLWDATPESLRRAAARGASGTRERHVPLAVTVGVLACGYLAIRWWRKR
jgi:ABC-type transporter Mla subunit MlaD